MPEGPAICDQSVTSELNDFIEWTSQPSDPLREGVRSADEEGFTDEGKSTDE